MNVIVDLILETSHVLFSNLFELVNKNKSQFLMLKQNISRIGEYIFRIFIYFIKNDKKLVYLK